MPPFRGSTRLKIIILVSSVVTYLLPFSFQIRHRKGAANTNADYLSRCFEEPADILTPRGGGVGCDGSRQPAHFYSRGCKSTPATLARLSAMLPQPRLPVRACCAQLTEGGPDLASLKA